MSHLSDGKTVDFPKIPLEMSYVDTVNRAKLNYFTTPQKSPALMLPIVLFVT